MRRSSAEELGDLARRFVDGTLAWEPFHRAFIDRFVRADARFHASAEGRNWNRVYALVCGSLPDPVPAEVRAAGVIGAEELRQSLLAKPGP